MKGTFGGLSFTAMKIAFHKSGWPVYIVCMSKHSL